MAASKEIALSQEEFMDLHERYGFQEEDRITLPGPEAVITDPPEGKSGVYLKTFDAGYRLPSTDFCLSVLRYYGIHINQLVPNGVSKLVAFELLCRSQEIVPNVTIFRHFFRAAASLDLYTFYRRTQHVLIQEMKNPVKTWREKWLWVSNDSLGAMDLCTHSMTDKPPVLTTAEGRIVTRLMSFSIHATDFPEHVLAGGGLSFTWRLRGKMPYFYTVADGVENEVSFVSVLAQTYLGDLEFREVPLVEPFLPSQRFRSESFLSKVKSVQGNVARSVGMNENLVDASVVGVSLQDNPVIGSRVMGTEVVDSKEGVLESLQVGNRKKRNYWGKTVSGEGSGVIGVSRRTRQRQWKTNVATGVIDLSEDTTQPTLPPLPKPVEVPHVPLQTIFPDAKLKNVCEGKAWMDVGKRTQESSSGPFPVVSPPVTFTTSADTSGGSSFPLFCEPSALNLKVWKDFDDAPFRPDWKLTNNSRLSSVENALDFAAHAFPPGTVNEMSNHSHSDFARLMRIAAAQCAGAFVECASRLENLAEENVNVTLVKSQLQRAQADLQKAMRSEEKKSSELVFVQGELDAAEKRLGAVVEEKVALSKKVSSFAIDKASLDNKVSQLLTLNQELADRVKECERLLSDEKNKTAVKEKDVEWLIQEGFPGVIAKVLDSSAFGGGVAKFQAACLKVGEVFGSDKVIQFLQGSGDVEIDGDDPLVRSMEGTLDDFTLLDYAALFGLSRMSVEHIKAFVAAPATPVRPMMDEASPSRVNQTIEEDDPLKKAADIAKEINQDEVV